MTTTQNQSIYITTSNFMPKCEKLIKFKINGIQHILIPKKLQEINDVFIDNIFYDTDDEEHLEIDDYCDTVSFNFNLKKEEEKQTVYKIDEVGGIFYDTDDEEDDEEKETIKKPTNYLDFIPEDIKTIIYKNYFTDYVLTEFKKNFSAKSYKIYKSAYEYDIDTDEDFLYWCIHLNSSLKNYKKGRGKKKTSYQRVFNDYMDIMAKTFITDTYNGGGVKESLDIQPSYKEKKNKEVLKTINYLFDEYLDLAILARYKTQKYKY